MLSTGESLKNKEKMEDFQMKKATAILTAGIMASKDGVDLDSYTEKEIDEYDLDDYEEGGDYDDLDSSSDEIAYGDDKSGKDDVEELKLFDIDDDK